MSNREEVLDKIDELIERHRDWKHKNMYVMGDEPVLLADSHNLLVIIRNLLKDKILMSTNVVELLCNSKENVDIENLYRSIGLEPPE